jgi:hypothetical protein
MVRPWRDLGQKRSHDHTLITSSDGRFDATRLETGQPLGNVSRKDDVLVPRVVENTSSRLDTFSSRSPVPLAVLLPDDPAFKRLSERRVTALDGGAQTR